MNHSSSPILPNCLNSGTHFHFHESIPNEQPLKVVPVEDRSFIVPRAIKNSFFLVVMCSELEKNKWKETTVLDVYSCKSHGFKFNKASAKYSPNDHVMQISSLFYNDPMKLNEEHENKMTLIIFSIPEDKLENSDIRSRGIEKKDIEILMEEELEYPTENTFENSTISGFWGIRDQMCYGIYIFIPKDSTCGKKILY